MTALSRPEKIRRAVARAARAAGTAHLAAFRSRRRLGELRELITEHLRGASLPETQRAFLAAEVERLAVAANALEDAAWTRQHESRCLAELLGAEEERRG